MRGRGKWSGKSREFVLTASVSVVLAKDFFFAGELALAIFLLAEVGVVLALALEVGVAFDLGVVLLFLGCAQ